MTGQLAPVIDGEIRGGLNPTTVRRSDGNVKSQYSQKTTDHEHSVDKENHLPHLTSYLRVKESKKSTFDRVDRETLVIRDTTVVRRPFCHGGGCTEKVWFDLSPRKLRKRGDSK